MAIQLCSKKFLLALPLLLIGCNNTTPPAPAPEPSLAEAPAAAPAIDRMLEAQSLGLFNPSLPEPGLLCSGQLKPEQFEALSMSGYQTFINLRSPGESGTGFESELAASLDATYHNIPVAGAAGINEGNARALADLLATAPGPVVLYCGSSNRVGALYGLRAFYTQGKSPEESLALATSAGISSLAPRLKEALGMVEQN